MDLIDCCNAFSGGRLTDLHVDVERGTVAFTVRVLEAGHRSVFDAELHGVTDLRIRNQIEVPWNYADVTDFEYT
jgi:hypothetical protein